MQNQKSKLKFKNQIQKWESFSLIQKQNSIFQVVGSAFLFCKAIIAQSFDFVNRRKKFSYTSTQSAILPFVDAETATFALTQPYPYPHTSTHNLTILCVFVDGLTH